MLARSVHLWDLWDRFLQTRCHSHSSMNALKELNNSALTVSVSFSVTCEFYVGFFHTSKSEAHVLCFVNLYLPSVMCQQINKQPVTKRSDRS